MLVRLVVLCALVVLTTGAAKDDRDPDPTSSADTMESINYTEVPVEKKPLHVPALQEIAEVLSAGLRVTFEAVEVTVAECPDLTQPPFNLTSPGLSGNTSLVEIGGTAYLLPLVQRDKVYDLALLARHLHRDPAFICGAGAGPWPHLGRNCEGVINLTIRNGTVDQGSRVVWVDPPGAPKGSSGYKLKRLPDSETRTALLGNYLLSEGKPGKVVKVVASKRVGAANFITSIREALAQHYGDKVVGLGGTFLLRSGRAKHHVMPDFSATPVTSDAEVDKWLHYFEVRAPIAHVGTLVTGDLGLDLRVQHFHGWGEHGDGGHYHYDTTPDIVRYEGYFVPAADVLRVDKPVETNQFGRD